MPTEPYVTVTLRKDIVKKLMDLMPDMPTSTLVTDAIREYVNQKTPKTIAKKIDMPSIAYTGTAHTFP